MPKVTHDNRKPYQTPIYGTNINRSPSQDLFDQLGPVINLLARLRNCQVGKELVLEDISKLRLTSKYRTIVPALKDFSELFPNWNYSALNRQLVKISDMGDQRHYLDDVDGDWSSVYRELFRLMGTDSYEDDNVRIKINGFELGVENKRTDQKHVIGTGINYLLVNHLYERNNFKQSKMPISQEDMAEYIIDLVGEDALSMYANANPIAFFNLLVSKLGYHATVSLYEDIDRLLIDKKTCSKTHGVDLHCEVCCIIADANQRIRRA